MSLRSAKSNVKKNLSTALIFLWMQLNSYLCTPDSAQAGKTKSAAPIFHGFMNIIQFHIKKLQLALSPNLMFFHLSREILEVQDQSKCS